ncbi:hypothetical protein EV215_1741 [Hypnocyclicus thermotrophus]|uniref:Streptomycin adenylyltransferase n=1 Tax=Hypnocyclicus thermotrophus TaxID=1627895 RepID=A0AA46DXD5_9FUSO|nr:hypothetical protein [Hypnocyclicus thermotrophus]TDT68021.1 hypothetical protein EV215_1741 [Hypnocyclicus thermotrophus]
MFKDRLAKRLDEIKNNLKKYSECEAIIWMNSTGLELEEFNKYTGIDFIIFVKENENEFLKNISWLDCESKVIYAFKNRKNGYKVMYEDKIYLEFIIFNLDEIEEMILPEGRIIYIKNKFDINKFQIERLENNNINIDWEIGELITYIYLGLAKYNKGDKIPAFSFIQIYAVNRLLELAIILEENHLSYNIIEKENIKFQGISSNVNKFMQGYNKSKESALELIYYINKNFELNSFMTEKLIELAK